MVAYTITIGSLVRDRVLGLVWKVVDRDDDDTVYLERNNVRFFTSRWNLEVLTASPDSSDARADNGVPGTQQMWCPSTTGSVAVERPGFFAPRHHTGRFYLTRCGQDDHRHAVPLQASLQGVGGLVVQQALIPDVFLKHELPGEKRRPRKALFDGDAQVFQFIDRIGADRHVADGGHAQAAARGRRTCRATAAVCCRRSSTAPEPLKLPESTTPTDTKIVPLNCPGPKRMAFKNVWTPKPL